ncbi:MAG TPA: LytTR family DNA-binding domain-containing protein, partial [Gemmatimonadaceae bacterium]|nr:LytTR family DNA-binding domain-containing protein [Gemmatimonadaceae bacterium]
MSEFPALPFGVVIVEDEERARRTLRGVVAEDPELVLLAETAGSAAPEVVLRCSPLILLLDVQMPGMDGFAVLRALGKAAPPAVIFVTAYDEYAVEAFEFAAVDYVLKPFADDRLQAALTRAKTRIRSSGIEDATAAIRRLLAHLEGASSAGTQPRLVVRDGGRTLVFDPASIDWVEAQGVYVRLHMQGRHALVRESLAVIERRLEEYGFVRIHRSTLVNIGRIQEIQHRSHGDYSVRMRDGT